MSGLDDLYQDVIIDHSQHPRNFREIEGAADAEGYNPLCGDRIRVFLVLDDGHVRDASFTGSACAICTASASMMTQQVKDHAKADVQGLFERFHELLTRPATGDEFDLDADASSDVLGDLVALGGVRRFPMRVKCATLPWHTLKAALEQQSDPVSTE